MDFTPISTAPTAAAKQTSKAVTGLSSDFDTFIQMLTAQARFQDPLEPLDSSQYAAQLAQFSMVEQQVKTNEALSTLVVGTSGLADLANWVGMDARTAAPVRYAGGPIEVTPQVALGADTAFLSVRDTLGTQVARIEIPTDAGLFEWTGRTASGAELPYGQYRLEIESLRAGETIATAPAETYSRISEAQVRGLSAVLVLEGGVAIASEDVTALRSPAP